MSRSISGPQHGSETRFAPIQNDFHAVVTDKVMVLGHEDDFSPFYVSVKCPLNTYVGKRKALSGIIAFQNIVSECGTSRIFFSRGG